MDPHAIDQVRDHGQTKVIVHLRASVFGDDPTRAAASDAAATALLRTLPEGSYEDFTSPETVPVITITVGARALDALSSSSLVASVESDSVLQPTSLNSSTLLGVQRAVAHGWSGAGQTIAVVDTGVESSHSLLMDGSTPKTIAEACFSSNSTTLSSSCAWGTPMSANSAPVHGSGQPCDLALSISCGHGTAVAGVALGGVGGRGGVPGSGVSAVALNVTAVNPTAPGFLTVYPTGSPRPTASNLNFVSAEVVPNMVISPVDSLGRVQLFNFAARTDIVVDVLGWFPPTPTFTALRAARLLDTRGGPTADGLWSGGGPISEGATLDVRVTGRAGVPSSGVAAVLVNLTVAQPSISGFLTAYPAATPRPGTSSINFAAGQTLANLTIVPVGADGRISIYNLQGWTPVIIDVLGWFGGVPG